MAGLRPEPSTGTDSGTGTDTGSVQCMACGNVQSITITVTFTFACAPCAVLALITLLKDNRSILSQQWLPLIGHCLLIFNYIAQRHVTWLHYKSITFDVSIGPINNTCRLDRLQKGPQYRPTTDHRTFVRAGQCPATGTALAALMAPVVTPTCTISRPIASR